MFKGYLAGYMVYVTDMAGFTAIKRSISQDVFEFAKLT